MAVLLMPWLDQKFAPGMTLPGGYYVCDTEAERPATSAVGCLCFTKDTNKLWAWYGGAWNAVQGSVASVSRLEIPVVVNTFAWTNQPIADTELLGNTQARFKADLTGYTEYRWMVNVVVAGVTGADLRLQYSADDSVYADLSGEIDIGTAGRKITNWAALPVGARTDVWVRVMGKQGNATADPQLAQIRLEVR